MRGMSSTHKLAPKNSADAINATSARAPVANIFRRAHGDPRGHVFRESDADASVREVPGERDGHARVLPRPGDARQVVLLRVRIAKLRKNVT